MSDYKVTVKVENGNLTRAITDAGYVVGKKFCDSIGIGYGILNGLTSMKIRPIGSDGFFRPEVMLLCELLNKAPSDLFSDEQITETLKANRVSLYLKRDDIESMLGSTSAANTSIEHKEVLDRLMLCDSLTSRERKVLNLIFTDGAEKTEIADEFGLSNTRIAHIEAKAIRKLRQSCCGNSEFSGLSYNDLIAECEVQ